MVFKQIYVRLHLILIPKLTILRCSFMLRFWSTLSGIKRRVFERCSSAFKHFQTFSSGRLKLVHSSGIVWKSLARATNWLDAVFTTTKYHSPRSVCNVSNNISEPFFTGILFQRERKMDFMFMQRIQTQFLMFFCGNTNKQIHQPID